MRDDDVVAEVADQYRSRGYDVTVLPRVLDLPEPLRAFAPDLVAHKGGQHVVVEIMTSARSRGLGQLGRVVQNLGWRLDLRNRPVGEDGALLTPGHISEWLQTVRELLERDARPQALLMVWSALEAALTRIALDHQIPPSPWHLGALARQLVSEGLMSDAELEVIDRTLRIRDQVAHGRLPDASITRADIATLIDLTDWYASPRCQTLGELVEWLELRASQGLALDSRTVRHAARESFGTVPAILLNEATRLALEADG